MKNADAGSGGRDTGGILCDIEIIVGDAKKTIIKLQVAESKIKKGAVIVADNVNLAILPTFLFAFPFFALFNSHL